jgi:two-component system sensor histidine kinase UhpB
VIPPAEQADVEQAIRHAAQDGGAYEIDHRVLRPDGEERIVRERATVERDDTGRPLRMVGTVLDITDLKRAEEELRRSREELRVLARGLQSVREEERERMAREIHDELGQALTGIKMDLMWIAGRLPPGQWSLTDRIHAVVRTTDAATDTVRRIASRLRPGVLDDLGLMAAIEWVVEDFARRTSIHVETTLPEIPPRVDRELATALFRILQESLTNVARHAAARRVQVRLWVENEQVFLEVRDDGRGVQTDPATLPQRRALGVLGMRERAGALGGDISVTGGPGKGTTVLARVPLRSPP